MVTIKDLLDRLDLTNNITFIVDNEFYTVLLMEEIGHKEIDRIAITACIETMQETDVQFSIFSEDPLSVTDILMELPVGASYIKLTLNITTKGGD
jgi:hypothetical protein